jgi:hypothetical protein
MSDRYGIDPEDVTLWTVSVFVLLILILWPITIVLDTRDWIRIRMTRALLGKKYHD